MQISNDRHHYTLVYQFHFENPSGNLYHLSQQGLTMVIRTDRLKTRAELDVLRTYVENQAILEPILLYLASKYKQTKEQGSEDCLWTHIFTFL